MESQNRKYVTVTIGYDKPVDLDILETALRASSLFSSTEPIKLGGNLIMETTSGSDIWFKPHSVTFQWKDLLEEDYLMDAIKKSIIAAREFETVTTEENPLRFNHNSFSLGVGNFDSEEIFKRELGLIVQELQRKLYGGGNVAYHEFSGDYNLDLGTEQEIDQYITLTQDKLGTKKLEFEGTTQPTASLDELLDRIDQSSQ